MANNKIYVGNLNKNVAEQQLEEHFSAYGEVIKIHLPRDDNSNEAKGYGFVSYADESQAEAALAADGTSFLDQAITVQIATEKRAKKDKTSKGRGRHKPRTNK